MHIAFQKQQRATAQAMSWSCSCLTFWQYAEKVYGSWQQYNIASEHDRDMLVGTMQCLLQAELIGQACICSSTNLKNRPVPRSDLPDDLRQALQP